uniref:Uncharacterized protein n=1 Tax=Steinernema glaseri TaxID=37863 RepID=A0A1I7ZH59_9BILA
MSDFLPSTSLFIKSPIALYSDRRLLSKKKFIDRICLLGTPEMRRIEALWYRWEGRRAEEGSSEEEEERGSEAEHRE